MGKTLIIEDNNVICSFLLHILLHTGHSIVIAESFPHGKHLLENDSFDLVIIEASPKLTNTTMPSLWLNDGNRGVSGHSFLIPIIHTLHNLIHIPEFIFIAKGGFSAESKFAIDNGAIDYIQLPIPDNMHNDCSNYLDPIKNRLITAINYAHRVADGSFIDNICLEGLIGKSWRFRRSLIKLLQSLQGNENVLICGESGTGKRHFSSIIHRNSDFNDHNLYLIDCRSESQFITFFQDEDYANTVLFSGGSILFYEVDSLPYYLQSQLLSKLKHLKLNSSFNSVIGFRNSRILSSISGDPDDLLNDGNFLDDLFWCLSSIKIELPPLKERGNDILLIKDYYWQQLADDALSLLWPDHILDAFCRYNWPGNIPELINTLKHIRSNIHNDKTLDICHLPDNIKNIAIEVTNYSNIATDDALTQFLDTSKKGIHLSSEDATHIRDLNESSISEQTKILQPPLTSDNITYCFYQNGDYWLIGKPGHERHLKRLDGFSYIRVLLQFPNRDFKPIDLYHNNCFHYDGEDFHSSEQVGDIINITLDKLSLNDRKVVSDSIKLLEDRLHSDSITDPVELMETKEKLTMLKASLSNKSVRDPKSSGEKARTNVTKKIKNAMKIIHSEDSELAFFLNASTIRTGDSISYRPVPGQIPKWILDRD